MMGHYIQHIILFDMAYSVRCAFIHTTLRRFAPSVPFHSLASQLSQATLALCMFITVEDLGKFRKSFIISRRFTVITDMLYIFVYRIELFVVLHLFLTPIPHSPSSNNISEEDYRAT